VVVELEGLAGAVAAVGVIASSLSDLGIRRLKIDHSGLFSLLFCQTSSYWAAKTSKTCLRWGLILAFDDLSLTGCQSTQQHAYRFSWQGLSQGASTAAG
jgi:hypothetical protein